jgi:hypothetical protein
MWAKFPQITSCSISGSSCSELAWCNKRTNLATTFEQQKNPSGDGYFHFTQLAIWLGNFLLDLRMSLVQFLNDLFIILITRLILELTGCKLAILDQLFL